MNLGWQILLFLLVSAGIGGAIGWLIRGARAEAATAGAARQHAGAEAVHADERERLRTELGAARDASAKLEASLADSEKLADARAARVRELEEALDQARRSGARDAADQPRSSVDPPASGAPPLALAAPEGVPDDLKQISGIGPGIEKTLHGLGIFHFRQIAAFTPDNVAWINQHLRFRGRIERERWVEQARTLAAGGTPEARDGVR